ncbi:hypothetical protein L484_027497 [Morus notabilis]|uniref:Filament-like plant protein 7 n=1 Tax=Morus notabilis TaxID=981085 RepID=W9SMH6_9ROSA|nr:filament-like plant protein 7 [Morus notabilis]EXC17309.1 hypothetical protein L484_027497 [Morus notabilis]
MDHKTWLWRKKSSSEKTILVTDKVVNPLRRTEDLHPNPTEKGVGSERSAKTLNEKLASVLLDCHVKEDPDMKDTKMAEETVTGKEKAEQEKVSPKKELGEALNKGVAESEIFIQSDDALKECKKQLSIVREEQEQKIRDAVMMTSREYEKVQKKLEEKFAETSKQLASLSVENSNLTKALLVKEKMIEDLNRRKTQSEAEFSALMTRQDSTEKENAFLKYEFHMLEKELQIRNEEMEYYRRSFEASQKQHLESLKKMAMLEQECQRLRPPMRKRLPGPTGNMRSDVQVKRRNQTDLMRRRKPNLTKDLIVREAAVENSSEILSKDMNFMFDRLCIVEEENEALKKLLNRKSPVAASRFLGSDMQLLELHKGQKSIELTRGSHMANKLSMSSDFDISSDDAISSSGSWANALISELEHFKNEKVKDPPYRKAFEVSDISLMDDFVEMEKLAIVSADKPSGNGYPSLTCKDLVSVAEDRAHEKPFDWLQVVLRAMLEQKHVSKRSLEELLGDIKIALGFVNSPTTREADKTTKSLTLAEADTLPISGYLPWNSPKWSLVQNTAPEVSGNRHIQHGLSESICKIIKLIQELNPASLAEDHSLNTATEKDQKLKPSATPVDYFIRVFQWTRSGLDAILQRFLQTCDDLLNGKSDLEKFAEEVASTLDWILNNYVAPKEAASTRDKIKKHFGWDEPQRENDLQVCLPTEELDVVQSEERSLGWPLLNSKEDRNALIQVDTAQYTLQEENRKLKNELKNVISTKSDMEARLNSATEKGKDLTIQLQESQQRVGSLQAELEALKETKGTIEHQIENEKLINDDLDTQLNVTKAKLNEVFQKVSSLEVELEDKRNCCEELEATCLELQLQLESDPMKETPKCKINQEERQSQSGWEITTASAKLAECQETIANLGKQLKALATPREAALLDRVFSDTATKDEKLNKRSSLRDRMLAEDDAKAENLNCQKVKDTASSGDTQKPSFPQSDGQNATESSNVAVHTPVACRTSSCKPGNNAAVTLAIVPSKKKGGGFDLLRRLLLRRKKRNSQKPQFSAKV